MTREYPKIETLFDRDKETFRVDESALRDPAFDQIKKWVVTEKIDGTNIRVALEQETVLAGLTYGGVETAAGDWVVNLYARTDAGQIPVFLREYLEQTFTLDLMKTLWRDGEYPVTLYGEGYGERIQKGGGNYRKGVSFRLFDVLVAEKYWLDWRNVVDIASRIGIKWVPCLGTQTMAQIITLVRDIGVESAVAYEENQRMIEAEGVVARSDPYLYDKHGRPLKFKLKKVDYTGKGKS